MFSLLDPAAFSPPLLAHLTGRLSRAALEEIPTLSADKTNSGLVVLSAGKPGAGVVDHAFPSLCIREPELQHLLDDHIDEFLAKFAERPAIAPPPAKPGKRVPATH